MTDSITLTIKAIPQNESFARIAVAAYASRLNPTLNTLEDIKTAVSEAVTNAIVHAYAGNESGEICINCEIADGYLRVSIEDFGCGIHNLKQAMTDFFTTKPSEERSGIGFTIMAGFMDSLDVKTGVDAGTTVTMTKRLSA